MPDIPTERHDRIVAAWLFCCCGLVFAMVVLGGVTRLTGSGLSMVDWRPVTGILPPLSAADWAVVFADYQNSPEYTQVNRGMTLEAFRGIFWLEYLHRVFGRVIGVVFFIPLVFFLARGYIPARHWPKYALMFVLGGLQGVLGWYMVKSGLVDEPHVSQYRLAAHLGAAFLIYATMFWVALGLWHRCVAGPPHAWFRRTLALGSLIIVTIFSGALVAGLKAGYVYNSFPKMAGEWVPPGLFALQPAWRNFFDNIVTVQFDHRILAVTTLCAVLVYWTGARRAALPQRARVALWLLPAVAAVQLSLGITILVLHMPLALAAAHQATALVLFSVMLYLCHALARQDAVRRP